MFYKKTAAITKLIEIILDRNFLILSFLAMILLFVVTIVVYFVEVGINPRIETYFDSFWWGVTTITTIGFGDIVPITFLGRIIAIFLMLTGPVLFVLFTGALLRVLIQKEVSKELFPVNFELQKEEQATEQIAQLLKNIEKRLEQLEKK